jgi:hypothetical protein
MTTAITITRLALRILGVLPLIVAVRLRYKTNGTLDLTRLDGQPSIAARDDGRVATLVDALTSSQGR